MSDDRSRTLAAITYFGFSTALLVAPAYTYLGNRVHPRVLGIPWSFAYVLLIVVANFGVLGLMYRFRVAAGAEEEDG